MTAPINADSPASAAAPLGPISKVTVKRGSNGAWHVRYQQDGERKTKRNFGTEAQALAWVSKLIEKFGGAM